jgi:hypothetical protein
MFFAENEAFIRVLRFFLFNHQIIVLNQALFNCTSYMEPLYTPFVVTLDGTPRILLRPAYIARYIVSINVNFRLNLPRVIINKPYFWCPVNAANMPPALSLRLFHCVLDNNPLKVIAKITTYVSWVSLRELLKMLASLTEPIFI